MLYFFELILIVCFIGVPKKIKKGFGLLQDLKKKNSWIFLSNQDIDLNLFYAFSLKKVVLFRKNKCK